MIRLAMRRHWRRFLLQIAILISMVVVNAIDGEFFVTVVALSLVAFLAATWTVFGILLWMSSKAPEIESLADRVDDALSAALGSTVAAGIALLVLGRQFGIITAPVGSFITVGLSFVVVTISVPSLSQTRTAVRIWLPMIRQRGLPADGDR